MTYNVYYLHKRSRTSMNNESKDLSIDDALKIASKYFEDGKYQSSLNLYTQIQSINPNILIVIQNSTNKRIIWQIR